MFINVFVTRDPTPLMEETSVVPFSYHKWCQAFERTHQGVVIYTPLPQEPEDPRFKDYAVIAHGTTFHALTVPFDDTGTELHVWLNNDLSRYRVDLLYVPSDPVLTSDNILFQHREERMMLFMGELKLPKDNTAYRRVSKAAGISHQVIEAFNVINQKLKTDRGYPFPKHLGTSILGLTTGLLYELMESIKEGHSEQGDLTG